METVGVSHALLCPDCSQELHHQCFAATRRPPSQCLVAVLCPWLHPFWVTWREAAAIALMFAIMCSQPECSMSACCPVPCVCCRSDAVKGGGAVSSPASQVSTVFLLKSLPLNIYLSIDRSFGKSVENSRCICRSAEGRVLLQYWPLNMYFSAYILFRRAALEKPLNRKGGGPL